MGPLAGYFKLQALPPMAHRHIAGLCCADDAAQARLYPQVRLVSCEPLRVCPAGRRASPGRMHEPKHRSIGNNNQNFMQPYRTSICSPR
jgi:hypothetical protein